MDLNYSWSQPEHQGPAQRIWSKVLNDIFINKINNQSSNNLHNYPYYQNEIPIYATFTGLPKDHFFNPPIRIADTFQDDINLNDSKIKFSNQILEFIKRKRDYNKASTFGYETQLQIGKISTIPSDIYPWNVKGRNYPKTVDGLHDEIVDFYNYIMPTVEEKRMRQEVVDRLKEVVLSEWPEATVDVFGSFKTELHLPTSDIDVVIFGKYENPLWKLNDIIKKSGISSDCKVIDKATVPIVKMTDRETEVRIDISFNMENGLKSAELIKNYIAQYPKLPHLVLLLKQYLLQRDLNEVWTGGISSYSLILMCVSFMKDHSKRFKSEENLGILFIGFLEMYGRTYDYATTGIRTEGEICYVPKEDILRNMDGRHCSSILCIEDPLNSGNDIGRSSYGALHVKLAFEYAYTALFRVILNPSSNLYSDQISILGRIIRITPEVIQYRESMKVKYNIEDSKTCENCNFTQEYDKLIYPVPHFIREPIEAIMKQEITNNTNNSNQKPKCIISEKGDIPSKYDSTSLSYCPSSPSTTSSLSSSHSNSQTYLNIKKGGKINGKIHQKKTSEISISDITNNSNNSSPIAISPTSNNNTRLSKSNNSNVTTRINSNDHNVKSINEPINDNCKTPKKLKTLISHNKH